MIKKNKKKRFFSKKKRRINEDWESKKIKIKIRRGHDVDAHTCELIWRDKGQRMVTENVREKNRAKKGENTKEIK